MTITYPITPPSSPKPSRIEWMQEDVISISRNKFTSQSTVQEHAGSRWYVSVTLPPMTRATFAPWSAFKSKLHGQRGTFTFGSYLLGTAQGTGAGNPKVNTGSQSGFTLITDGWTPSSAVLKAGDMIQIDTSLYQVLEDATANGSGQATLDIWPRLREHADNAVIVCASTKGLFRLADSKISLIETDQQLFQFSFLGEEAI
jgi:hypothetical protein